MTQIEVHEKGVGSARDRLFKKQIYPPIHSAITDVIPKIFNDNLRLPDHIMTLICNQCSIIDNMLRTVNSFR
jgi:hypothetical protein